MRRVECVVFIMMVGVYLLGTSWASAGDAGDPVSLDYDQMAT